jgi:hypothetical protein
LSNETNAVSQPIPQEKNLVSIHAAANWPEPSQINQFQSPVIPDNVIPTLIEDYARASAAASGFCWQAYAMSMLVVISGLASDKIKLHYKGTWTERPKLWGALIAEPGVGKTPIFKPVTAEMYAINEELISESRRMYAEYMSRVKDMEKMKKEDRYEIIPPPDLCLVVDTATIEYQQKLASDNPRGLTILRGEASSLIRSKDPKKFDQVLEMLEYFDGGSRSKGTLKDGMRNIKNWSAAFLTTIQPQAIAKGNEVLLDTGFVQRFLPILLPPQENVRVDLSVDDSAYRSLCRRIWNLDPNAETVFHFSREAWVLAADWETKIHHMRKSKSISSNFSQHFAKYPIFFLRLILVYHIIDMVENTSNIEVQTRTVEQVIALMDQYVFPSSQSFYLSSFSGTGPAAVATKVCERLKTDAYLGVWSVTERSLSRNVRAFAEAAPDVRRKALQLIESHGWGRKHQEKASNGKMMQTIQINPRVMEIIRAEDHRDTVDALDAASYAAPGSPTDFY